MNTDSTEVWKEVKDFEVRFWISSYGRLKSHDIRRNTIKILSCYVDSQGYYQATLRMKPLKKKVRIHTLVAEHFLFKPDIEGRITVNHKDGNKLNNRVENLEWISAKDNCLHAVEMGLHDLKGSKHHQAKITEDNVREMRSLYPLFTHKQLAEMYGLARRNVGDIINRVTWPHVV